PGRHGGVHLATVLPTMLGLGLEDGLRPCHVGMIAMAAGGMIHCARGGAAALLGKPEMRLLSQGGEGEAGGRPEGEEECRKFLHRRSPVESALQSRRKAVGPFLREERARAFIRFTK